MTSSIHPVLMTQCIQRDFIEPLPAHQPLPNALHVGHREAQRLLGVDPTQGPIAQLMHWARNQPEEDLSVVHIRDWHDPEDPAQQAHLEQFGAHCIQNTPGAELMLDLDAEVLQRPNEWFVNSISLNDFEGTTLDQHLNKLRENGRTLRIGVVGVWTEAKITFLLYDLLTRGYAAQLATCSALTASASRTQHFNALDQLKKILGVQVFDSIGDFTSWLLPQHLDVSLPQTTHTGQNLIEIEGADLTKQDATIVQFLYRDSAKVVLDALSGGFSGALVYRAQSFDALGHKQSPTVLKIANRDLVGHERASFERIESILGNNAPSIKGFADFQERGGLKYAYASMGQGKVSTFKSLFESGCPQEQIDAILKHTFLSVLDPFFSAAQYERLPLLEYYTFDSRYADGVRARVAAILEDEQEAEKPELHFPNDFIVPNVADFYQHTLDTLPRPKGEFHHVSYVHGDLNGANILLDERENIWLIDFYHAHRGHILRDLAKLENDLLYIFTPLADEEDLGKALEITKALAQVKDLRAPLGSAPDVITDDARFMRTWATLRTLREIVAKVCLTERSAIPLHIAKLRYAVHTFWFDEANAWQKRWALAAAGNHTRIIEADAHANKALRVGWLDTSDLSLPQDAKLGVTICPGRRDRNRELRTDLETLKKEGVSGLFGFLTPRELDWAGVSELPTTSQEFSIQYEIMSVQDQTPPSIEELRPTIAHVLDALQNGERLVFHCMGGLGRSGTAAACALVALGLSADEAIARIRAARGPRAVESKEQEDFVEAFFWDE